MRREAERVTIKVVVGEGKDVEQFLVHQDCLTKHSKFAAVALSSSDRKENILDLPEEEPRLFKIFYKFLHCGNIDCDWDSEQQDITEGQSGGEELDKAQERDEIEDQVSVEELGNELDKDGDGDQSDQAINENRHIEELERLIDLWVLGDRLMSTSFKDAVMDHLTTLLHNEDFFEEKLHEKIYPRTAGRSALCSLAVDHAFANWTDDVLFETEMDESWNEFFRDFAIRTVMGFPPKGEPIFEASGCIYHEHRGEEVCYKEVSWQE